MTESCRPKGLQRRKERRKGLYSRQNSYGETKDKSVHTFRELQVVPYMGDEAVGTKSGRV